MTHQHQIPVCTAEQVPHVTWKRLMLDTVGVVSTACTATLAGAASTTLQAGRLVSHLLLMMLVQWHLYARDIEFTDMLVGNRCF